MNILVTGGAGFIGSQFVLRHYSRFPQDSLIVLDLLTYAGHREFLSSVASGITFVQGDIADQALVDRLVQTHRIDTILNFAAETHVDRSIEDASAFLHTNILGVQSLIDVCRRHPTLLLYHISTDEVYGDQHDDEARCTTEHILQPSSPYAASKAAADLLLLAAVRTHGIRVRISRCTNNYGPHQAEEKFIPTVIRCALRDLPVPIYAQGHNRRDWLFVTDHCDAIDTILVSDDTDRLVYNIAAQDERMNIDVAKALLRLLDKPVSLLTFVPDRPGHDWRYAVDAGSAHALGWRPSVSFEEGLARTVAWYRARFV